MALKERRGGIEAASAWRIEIEERNIMKKKDKEKEERRKEMRKMCREEAEKPEEMKSKSVKRNRL